jgi:uncharacterized membrane protein YfcA
MSPLHAVVIVAAGFVAGMMNVVVGAGSLVTFPVLLALGYPAVEANVSNTIGLVFGSLSGSVAYRRELAGQRARLLALGVPAAAGALCGGILLLELPARVFTRVVPILILAASVLVLLQPRLARRLAAHREHRAHGGIALVAGVFVTGVYGGYFGAAQGVILLALLGTFLADGLQRLNATKNVLALAVNAVAAGLFALLAVLHVDHVAWLVSLWIAMGSIVGGQVGGAFGRRLPAPVLRVVIVVVGLSVSLVLFVRWK